MDPEGWGESLVVKVLLHKPEVLSLISDVIWKSWVLRYICIFKAEESERERDLWDLLVMQPCLLGKFQTIRNLSYKQGG